MSDEIDLGISDSERYPKMGGETSVAAQMDKGSERKSYPQFTIELPESLDLPEEGTMTVSFKRKSETKEKRHDGSEWYRCVVEVQSVLDVDENGEEDDEDEDDMPKAPAKSGSEAADALDKLASEYKE